MNSFGAYEASLATIIVPIDFTEAGTIDAGPDDEDEAAAVVVLLEDELPHAARTTALDAIAAKVLANDLPELNGLKIDFKSHPVS